MLEEQTDATTEIQQYRELLIQTIADAKTYVDRNQYQGIYVAALELKIRFGEDWLLDSDEYHSVESYQSIIDGINELVDTVKQHPKAPGEIDEPSKGLEIEFLNDEDNSNISESIHLDGDVGESWRYSMPKEITDIHGVKWKLRMVTFGEWASNNLPATSGTMLGSDQKEANGVFNENHQVLSGYYVKDNDQGNNGNNQDGNGGNQGNNGNNHGGNSGNQGNNGGNQNNNSNNQNGNGDNQSNNSKGKGTDNKGISSKNNAGSMPKTGERYSVLPTLSGITLLAATAFLWLFKRKRVIK